MNIKDLAEKALVFDSEENVSKAISKMFSEKKSEAVIIDNDMYRGVLDAKNLAKRNITNPDNVKIKKFITHTPLAREEMNVRDIINSMMVNDYKSLPAKIGDEYFFITKINLLRYIKNDASLKNKTASDIMVTPFCVDIKDSIRTVSSVLRDSNVSRLPVLNEKGKAEGIIDSTHILKANIEKTKSVLGERAGEMLHPDDVLASSLMERNITLASPKTSIKDVINTMAQNNTQSVLIDDGEKIVGIITPKLILKLLGREMSGVYVTISGIQEEDAFIKSVVDEEIANAIRKLGKMLPIDYLVVHVDKYHETGERVKYSVKARLITEKGFYFSGDYAWDLTKAVRGVLQKLEKEIIKKIGKARLYKRSP